MGGAGRSFIETVIRCEILESLAEPNNSGRLLGNLQSLQGLKKTSDILEMVIMQTEKPLFVVLDNVGGAFNSREVPDKKRSEIFWLLCEEILVEWLRVTDLYFILIGSGNILHTIAVRNPESYASIDRLTCCRISLPLLREEHYKTILLNTTKRVDGQDILLAENYGFEASWERWDELVAVIKHTTNGHPRSMFDMFRDCQNIEELLAYQGGALDVALDFNSWVEGLFAYYTFIDDFLSWTDKKCFVNLLNSAHSDTLKPIPQIELAKKALIGWEGPINRARLFVSPRLRGIFSILNYPCKRLLSYYPEFGLPEEGSNNFETACLYRFQEMFDSPCCPGTTFAEWFEGTRFGEIDDFRVSRKITAVPKVTKYGLREFESFEQETIHADSCHLMFSEMKKRVEGCFNQHNQPGDIIFISPACDNNGKELLFTVGMTVKASATEILEDDVIKDAIFSFNQMLRGRSPDASHDRNVLIICCICCTPSGKFVEGKNYLEIDCSEYEYVDEVIDLNLSSPALRQALFG